MSDHDNISVGQSYIEMKIELAFAAGVFMSLDRSVQRDFILTYATFYRTLFRVANASVLARCYCFQFFNQATWQPDGVRSAPFR